MTYETLLTEIQGSGERRTGVIRLNRPKQLNALNDTLMNELGAALKAFDDDSGIGCIGITGNEKAFAAGADISTLAQYDFARAYNEDLITRNWEHLKSVRKPVIAAVAGFALGGGCERTERGDILPRIALKFGQSLFGSGRFDPNKVGLFSHGIRTLKWRLSKPDRAQGVVQGAGSRLFEFFRSVGRLPIKVDNLRGNRRHRTDPEGAEHRISDASKRQPLTKRLLEPIGLRGQTVQPALKARCVDADVDFNSGHRA